MNFESSHVALDDIGRQALILSKHHSPADLIVTQSYPIHGEFFSVAPSLMRKLPKLTCINERCVILSKWKHGFFSVIPVGAAVVGSIKLNEEFRKLEGNGKNIIAVNKGDELGKFELGSTVVLLFEAPRSFQWSDAVSKGDGCPIKLGQSLGSMTTTSSTKYTFSKLIGKF